MSKIFNQEIADLKRHQYWLNVELKKVDTLLAGKADQIRIKIDIINELISFGAYEQIKVHERWKVAFLKEQEALISLQCKLLAERGENGREIIKLRNGIVNESVNTYNLGKLRNIHWACSKLVKLVRSQKTLNVAKRQWVRMQQQVINNKPIINYRGKAYPLESLPWSLEQINTRIDAYNEDQKRQGLLIIKMRNIICNDPLQKQTYNQVIKNIKLAQSANI